MTTVQAAAGRGVRVDWAGLAWAFLFFWYFSGVTQALIQLTGTAGFTGFRQAFLLSSLWLIPLLLFPARARLLAALIGVPLWLCSLAGFGYFLIYGQEFSQSVIFILFESNVSEGREYLAQYFAWWMVPAFLAYGLGAWLLWRRIRPVYLPRRAAVLASVVLFAVSLGYPAVRQFLKQDDPHSAFEHFAARLEPATPWQLLVGYQQYRSQLDNMQALLDGASRIPPLTALQDAHAGQPATLVLVIGESTNRQRMSLYGYGRETTPELDKLRGQLQLFDNVVTPRPYTIEALQQVLTFADQQHPDAYLRTPSLIRLMKQAGYRTYWITNQQTMTKRNTMLTTFSEEADEQVYLNNNREQNARQYDGDVLEPFARVLGEDATDRLEAAPMPAAVVAACRARAARSLPVSPPPPGAMNAPAVLRELLDAAGRRREGEPAHIVNLTLLPMTPDDLAYLSASLGVGPVVILSRGYGNCRISSTALRDTWWVQYFNSSDSLILNTLEVTDLPDVAPAAAEDYADSIVRLGEWIEALREE